MWIHLLALELIDGASSAEVSVAAAGGYYGDDKKPAKKRFIVERDGKLMVFNSAQAAVNAIPEQAKSKEATQPVEVVEVVADVPEQIIELPQVKEYAYVMNRIEAYNEAYNGKHYEALIEMFTTLQAQAIERMQDEDDIELLLLA